MNQRGEQYLQANHPCSARDHNPDIYLYSTASRCS